MSGLFGSTTIKGTRITDFAKTSADVGSTIPFLYGRAPVTGNVGFAALPPKETRNVKKQGKGGVKQESFTYSTSYCILFCRGPINGWWWIKRNGKVVYTQDPEAPIDDAEYAAKWAARVQMFNGTMSQMPSSIIESYKGAGRVSPFRGIAGIVIPHEDVTDGGGAIPSYEAVPMASPSEVYFTSHPYDQYAEDASSYRPRLTGGELRLLVREAESDEESSYRPQLMGGYLGIKLLSVGEDERSSYSPALTGGLLKSPLVDAAAPLEKAAYAPTLTGGDMHRQLVTIDMPVDKSSYAPSLTGGTLA